MNPAHIQPGTPAKVGIKSCVTCAHYTHTRTRMADYVAHETRCAIKLLDPVSGETGEPECQWARTWPHHCGWEGRWWQPAKQNVKLLPGLGG